MSCANSAPPLGLAWENITVSQDGRAISRGIALGVGNPQQIVSLRPSINDDNTWLFNAADCITANNATCIGGKGGVYNASESKTYSETTKAQWNGTNQPAYADLSFIYFNDDVRYGSNGSSLGFPLFMDQPGAGSQSGLGLGPKSVFLDAAVSSGVAPAKSFGLWVGSRSVARPVDGALWIGGYDSNRVNGPFTTFPVYDNCPTCVVITNLTFDTVSKGSVSLLANSSDTLTVSLDPFQRSLNVDNDMFVRFMNAANATVGTDPGTTALIQLPRNAELGNLTVTFANGYTTTIPSQEFFFPPRQFNANGVYEISNSSYLISSVANHSVPSGTAQSWGVPLLTMNYLVMDYANNQFKLAPALQGAYGSGESALIEPLCKGLTAVATSAVGAPSSTSTAYSSASPTPHKTNVGAIAGGVVGGVVGLAIIALLAFFLLRGKRREKNLRDERDNAVAENNVRHEKVSQYTSPTEVSEIAAADSTEHVNRWLHTQPPRSPPPPSSTSNTYTNRQSEYNNNHPNNATLNAPFEMPGDIRL